MLALPANLPPVVIDAFCEAVTQMTADDILTLWKIEPSLLPGHRRLARHAELARERLQSRMQRPEALSQPALQTLALYTSQKSVAAMSIEVLRDLANDWAAALGPGHWTAALLLDARSEVQTLGAAWVDRLRATPITQTLPDPVLARARLRNTLAGLSPVFALAEAVSAPASERARVEQDRAEESGVRVAEQQARRQAEREAAALKERFEALRQREASATRHANDLESALTQCCDERDSARAQCQALQDDLELRVRLALEFHLAEQAGPWLQKALLDEAQLEQTRAGDALKRAQAALDAQRQMDRGSGTVSALRAEILQRETMLQALQEAATDALQPLAIVGEAIKELAQEIEALRLRLPGLDPVKNPVEAALTAKLWMVTDTAQLARFREQLTSTRDLGLIDASKATAFEQQATLSMQRRWSIRSAQNHLTESVQATLMNSIERGLPAGLVIDGHNFIYQMPSLFEGCFKGDRPKPEARQRLIDWLTDVVARYPLLEIDLFFDSSEAGDHTVNDRLRVRFSGGRGPGRADEAMVSHLQWQTQSGKTRPRFVVTADQPLARRASALGAAILEPAALSLVVSKGEMLA